METEGLRSFVRRTFWLLWVYDWHRCVGNSGARSGSSVDEVRFPSQERVNRRGKRIARAFGHCATESGFASFAFQVRIEEMLCIEKQRYLWRGRTNRPRRLKTVQIRHR